VHGLVADLLGGRQTVRIGDVVSRHTLGADPGQIAGVAAVVAPKDDHQVERPLAEQLEDGVLPVLRRAADGVLHAEAPLRILFAVFFDERSAETRRDFDQWHPWRIDAEGAIALALAAESRGREFDPRIGNSDGAAFSPATMEAFSTQGNGTMTIVKEKSPTSFEVEQDLKTWPSNGARTIAFDSKTGHLFAMASELGPAPPPPPAGTPSPAGGRAGRAPAIPGSFTIIMVGK